MAQLPPMVSYYSKDFSLSMERPQDWEVGSAEAFPLLFLAPRHKGYRSNLGFSLGELEPATLEEFNAMIERSHRLQNEQYNEFKQVDELRFLQDECPAYVQRYEWTPPEKGERLSQVAAVILAGPENLYEIHGATLKELEKTYIPIFLHMIKSIRFIPEE